MPALEELYLGENEIANTDDLAEMISLKKLDLNTNKLVSLKGLPHLPSLEVLDVSANTIATSESISHLAQYAKLSKLSLAANPFADELGDKIKGEILFKLYPIVKVKFVGEEEIVEDDIVAWKAEKKDRLRAQIEAERLAAEKAAKVDEVETL